MSVRLTLLALSTLVLSACDGNPLQTAARETCCCDRCPTTAAPAATPPKPAKARPATPREAVRTVRVRYTAPVDRERGGYGYQETVTSGYGGRYGGGPVQQTGSASSGYSYSETSGGYAYGSASGGGYGYAPVAGPCCAPVPPPTPCCAPVPPPAPCCAPGGQGGPHYRGYRSASTDRDGYLTWPGKVED